MHPGKTQISLGINVIQSQSLLFIQWVAKGSWFFHADSKDSNQTGWMHRLIGVIAGHTCDSVVFSMQLLIYLY